MATTGSATTVTPIVYNLSNGDTIIISVDSSESQLQIVDNTSQGLWQYAYSVNPPAFQYDTKGYLAGAAQSFVLNTSTNPAFQGEFDPWSPAGTSINDGTLYFSAVNYQGVQMIAIYLDLSGITDANGNPVGKTTNGDGIYPLNVLVCQNWQQYENSSQQFFDNIASLIADAATIIATWNKDPTLAFAAGGNAVSTIMNALNNKLQSAAGQSLSTSVQSIAQQGWKAYLAQYGISTDPQTPINKQQPNPTGLPTWAWIVIIAAVLILIILLITMSGKKK
jgi:hypothetical protein